MVRHPRNITVAIMKKEKTDLNEILEKRNTFRETVPSTREAKESQWPTKLEQPTQKGH